MPLDLADYENKAKEAVKAFWGNRAAAVAKQKELGREDQGERAGVTAGKNMDGFIALIQLVIRANGLTDAHMMMERRVLTLPGFFRPTKLWDLLILNHGRLVAAIELKSQVGPLSLPPSARKRRKPPSNPIVVRRTSGTEVPSSHSSPRAVSSISVVSAKLNGNRIRYAGRRRDTGPGASHDQRDSAASNGGLNGGPANWPVLLFGYED